MAIAYVQSRSDHYSYGFGIGPTTLAFSSNVTAGNALVVAFNFYPGFTGTVTSSTCTDTLGNTYSAVYNQTYGGCQNVVFLAINCLGGANTVSVSVTVASSGLCFAAMAIHEYSGVITTGIASAAIDTSNFGNNGAGGSVSVSVTTSVADMLFCFSCFTSAPSSTIPDVPGFVRRQEQDGSSPQLCTHDLVGAGTPGLYTAAYPTLGASCPNQVAVIAIKGPGGRLLIDPGMDGIGKFGQLKGGING